MSAINDLISQIENVDLRQRIQKEVERMSKQKKFGLVFEEHLPECTPLYDIPVKRGATVALKTGKVNDNFKVLKISDGKALCEKMDNHVQSEIPVEDLVTVAQFGEPIYPYLKLIDSICNAPDSELWHTLIEADNYHALQLLEYLYAGKVDCIYIDPPYNTGARDWKYNNDYVDTADTYRHSKWLSMMQKRLKLAKRLLNPNDSVLIVTIDEKEYLHLGCLLEELFPDARIQMISSIINPGGVPRAGQFYRTNEFIFFIMLGESQPCALPLSEDWFPGKGKGYAAQGKVRWRTLRRDGAHNSREDRPKSFFPIYFNKECTKLIGTGDFIPLDVDWRTIPERENCYTVWPIKPDGTDGRWSISAENMIELFDQGYINLGHMTSEHTSNTTYLASGEREKVIEGKYSIVGRRKDGSIILSDSDAPTSFVPGTQWKISSHDATQLGTKILRNIIGKRFEFPKSLYAVHDTIRFFVAEKKNAIIIDFFAGSGTTLHAVNLLNAEDGGHRRCIMVTNNEVSDDESKALSLQGFKPGDKEWEDLGIARYVNWPRTICSIKGNDVNGNPLKGEYISSLEDFHMSDGFKANAIFFKLGFIDKNAVALGRQFKELLPILWMKGGAIGPCPQLNSKEIPDMMILPENRMAILIDANKYASFERACQDITNLKTIFIVTDSENGYREMISPFKELDTYQIYRDYLDNFRINHGR